jgi:aryl-alcohol dehydrogenase-like predicted oxidoreductase
MSISGKPTDVRRWCEESLKSLQVDSIDLYYQHRVSKIYSFHFIETITDSVVQVDRTIPIEETWKELKKLKEEGKVKYLGISEATIDEIRKAHAISPISALQVEVSSPSCQSYFVSDLVYQVLSLDTRHQGERNLGCV